MVLLPLLSISEVKAHVHDSVVLSTKVAQHEENYTDTRRKKMTITIMRQVYNDYVGVLLNAFYGVKLSLSLCILGRFFEVTIVYYMMINLMNALEDSTPYTNDTPLFIICSIMYIIFCIISFIPSLFSMLTYC